MILIGKEKIDDYKRRHPEAAASLGRWGTVVEATSFQSGFHLRKTFPKSYDYVPPHCHVFDIAQNRHRLVALVDFPSTLVTVLQLMDHRRYDRWRCM